MIKIDHYPLFEYNDYNLEITMKAKNNLYFYLLGEIVVTWKALLEISVLLVMMTYQDDHL